MSRKPRQVESSISEAAAMLGRRGAAKTNAVPKAVRSERARHAVRVRWARRRAAIRAQFRVSSR